MNKDIFSKKTFTDPATIPVIEETIDIGIKKVITERVVVTKKVNETEQTLQLSRLDHTYNIEHIPINQYIDEAPAPLRHEGNIMIIPVLKEVMVKRMLLVEEIRITKQVIESIDEQTFSLKQEEIIIERKK